MSTWISLVASVFALFGWFAIALAGPIEGDLFGYHLGSKYPRTDDTRGGYSSFGDAHILSEKPEKPPAFQRVEIVATLKTLTIANIYGTAEFSDEKQAKAFAAQYVDLLSAAHGNKCRPTEAYLGESLKLVCGGQYLLTVSYYAPGSGEKHKVQVGLTFDDESKAKKRILAQFEQERKQVEAEGKTHRLKEANKEQKLRGLQ